MATLVSVSLSGVICCLLSAGCGSVVGCGRSGDARSGFACGSNSCRLGRALRAGVEAAAVLGRPHLERAQERAAHRLWGAEAAVRGHGCDRVGAVLQLPAGRFKANALDIAG